MHGSRSGTELLMGYVNFSSLLCYTLHYPAKVVLTLLNIISSVCFVGFGTCHFLCPVGSEPLGSRLFIYVVRLCFDQHFPYSFDVFMFSIF